MKIERFRIDQKSNTDDLLMSANVEVQHLTASPKVDIPSNFDLGMLKTIAAGQLITVKAKVTSLLEPKILQTRRGTLKMLEGQIVDTKGYSKIVFWEKFCQQVEEGMTYIFENVRVKKDALTKQLYINTAKSGTAIKQTEPLTDILALAPRLTDDSITATVEGSVAGVISTSTYVACIKWNKKIEHDDNSDIITCCNCNMQQMKDLSQSVLCSTIFPNHTKEGKVVSYTF